ncbi:phosphopantetheine-containing protein [Frankia torreyi]|uniref:Phosphopantetheine-containing protein n=1 Tax=Frankia torreyi TaxID=1856 RepID=A0A0D8B897_9ACTN|nr:MULTISPECIES: acyl carrier protein [Frankia]KJE20159.1 phosphopantetheine-containing protein [Frankia torreyi]KQC35070.1 acyl carrier protein [Frankia sp. ACN1ag]KQM02447.1 phosphopantetheine-containing protein [Frankia sp. CpI1-P]
MTTVEEFVALVRDELGLPISADDIESSFDEIPGWDSVHLLWLLSILEQRTGRSVSLPDVLEASSLRGIYALTVA